LNTRYDKYGDYIDNTNIFNASQGWPAEATNIADAAGSLVIKASAST